MQNKPFTKSALLSRRAALSSVGVGLALLPGMRLLAGCSASDAAEDADTGADGGSDSATGGTGASGGKSATANGGESASGGRSATAIAWATGGTAAMTAVASYPDPFAATSDGCALTQGPCWAPSAPLRQDISEGEPGLPLRLALRLVQAADCSPVVGAEVEVWHCDVEGEYSAHDVENVAFCTGNDPTAIEAYFFRGRAISDAQGKVVFDGCFPGWYASRAVHIHLVARLADHAGESTTADAVLITQLFFPEDLTAEIFTRVAGYSDRGQPDTTLATDTVIGSLTDTTPYLLDYEKMDDWRDAGLEDHRHQRNGVLRFEQQRRSWRPTVGYARERRNGTRIAQSRRRSSFPTTSEQRADLDSFARTIEQGGSYPGSTRRNSRKLSRLCGRSPVYPGVGPSSLEA